MQEEDLLHLIKSKNPNLEIENHSFINTGRDNFVIIANDEIVFRIPRKLQTIEFLEKEKKLLDIVTSYISDIKIPKQEIIAGEYPFTKMPYIEGIFFSKEKFNELNNYQKDNIAQDIASFLRKLHSIPVKEFTEIGYKTGGTDEGRIKSSQETFQKLCSNILSPEVLQNVLDYIQDLGTYEYPNKVMTHGDIGGKNVFLNHNSNSVLGIIDFSDARIADPAIDFDCFRDFGSEFIQKIVDYYAGGEDLLKRSDFYKKRRTMRCLMHSLDKQLNDIDFQISQVNSVFSNYQRFNCFS